MSTESSSVVDKIPCPRCRENGEDTRGDNLVVYSDGHGHCFACGYHPRDARAADGGEAEEDAKPQRKAPGEFLTGEYQRLGARGITEETCRFLGYRVGTDYAGRKVQIADYYDDAGRLVAQHLRRKDKKFAWVGDAKRAGLFGQHKFKGGGKRLIITEGEIDALTVSQLQGNKWPVVSVPNGAQSAAKAIREQIEFVESFDVVVFAFDMDEPGRAAAQECAALLTPGKAHIANLPMKDANECLLAGKGKELLDALWNAKPYRPDGLIWIDDVIEAAKKPIEWGAPWAWSTLTKLTYGRRLGEVYALGAGTGVGKTDFFTQQVMFDVTELGLTVGVLYLEMAPPELAKRLAGKFAKRQFHIPDAQWTPEELEAALEQMRGKVCLYDSWGVTDWDVVRSKIQYMAQAYGIKHFYLDHLTALADPTAERESLEKLMGEMAGLAQKLDIIIHFVSHLATPEGKPHEEGGRVMIRHFKGARAIGFWSHFMFGLERDQQAEDPEVRRTTTFRVLKDRYTGRSTGATFGLKYDYDTGMLFECELPEKEAKASDFGFKSRSDDIHDDF